MRGILPRKVAYLRVDSVSKKIYLATTPRGDKIPALILQSPAGYNPC